MATVVSLERQTAGRQWAMLDNGAWQVTEVWQAVFDDEIEDPLLFYGSVLLPAVGDAHPENVLLKLRSVPSGSPPAENSLKAINFTLVWNTLALAGSKHDPDRYDDLTRATKSWAHRVVQEPVERAYVSDNGGSSFSGSLQPVANTVGDRFIPGLTRNRYLPVCRYSRNALAVPATVLTLPGLVNSDTYTLDGTTVNPGQSMIIAANVSVEKRFESYSFRTLDFEILCREEGFDESLLNRGLRVTVPVDGSLVAMWAPVPNGKYDDGSGEYRPWVPAQEPVILNYETVSAVAGVSVNNEVWAAPVPHGLGQAGAFTPHYRVFRHLTRTSFSALGFS